MVNHGINATQQATSVRATVTAESGVPFVVGVAPIQAATSPAKYGAPTLCRSWDEAVAALGYSEDWKKYTICEVMYAHFKLYGSEPVIFYNVLDLKNSKHKEDTEATDIEVSDHKAKLPFEAIADEKLVVKAAGGTGDPYVLNTDYAVYYDEDALVVELLEGGKEYAASNLNIGYSKVKADGVTTEDVVMGVEGVELCLTKIGTTPDLMLAPGYSHIAEVAAAMEVKGANINGILKAGAICDIDCSSSGAKKYEDVLDVKTKNNIIGSGQIACWPMVKLGDRQFHMSTHIAGVMATVDAGNDGCPYESPSNKAIQCDGLVLEDGTEVVLTLPHANALNNIGVVTAINFFNGWVAWGNYNACYPDHTNLEDVKDFFIPISRTIRWINNMQVKNFWTHVDNPLNRRLIDTVLDAVNIWMNGLTGSGYLYGARCEMLQSENPLEDIMAGKIRIHNYLASPPPAQQIDFITEYDTSYIQSALEE